MNTDVTWIQRDMGHCVTHDTRPCETLMPLTSCRIEAASGTHLILCVCEDSAKISSASASTCAHHQGGYFDTTLPLRDRARLKVAVSAEVDILI